MSGIDFIGFSAAFSVLASFCMTTIVALRTLALLSNVLFILYGLCAHIYPVLVLHIILLPINLIKLHRIKPNLTHARAVSSLSSRESSGRMGVQKCVSIRF
jgi:hypothetical protein